MTVFIINFSHYYVFFFLITFLIFPLMSYQNLKENARLDVFKGIAKRVQETEITVARQQVAVLKIQSLWRGCRTRSQLLLLHRMAIVIQTAYRAYRARLRYIEAVIDDRRHQRLSLYHSSATAIQRRWRGYHCRTRVHNFYARQFYLNGVVYTNTFVVRELSRTTRMCLLNP